MLIVVDVNVVLSSLLSKGDAFDIFAINNIFNKFEFVAPEFLLIELEKHKEEIFERSKLSKGEFDGVLKFVVEQITFIPKSEFSDCLPKGKELLSEHLKDVQYLALALKVNCPIFSGDKILKKLLSKTSTEVLSPKEMFDKR